MRIKSIAGQSAQPEVFGQRRIGVFGGTFNPPHLGHLLIADQVYREFGLEKVVVLPVGIPRIRRKCSSGACAA